MIGLLIESLRAHGVKKVFCVPGESYLDALDALHDADDIRTITCRQEGGAAFMAEAYAKLTGHPGICFVTRGPGACNASIGVHTAMQDSTPMILLVGQVARDQKGREAFQEVEYRDMFKPPFSKWATEISHAADIPRVFGDRPFALAGASQGGFGTILSQDAWLSVLRKLGVRHWAGGTLMVSRATQVFDEDGALRDEAIRKQLGDFLNGFAAWIDGGGAGR